jgi:predicted ATPase with chaperone activity
MMLSRITNFAFEARPTDLQVQLSGGSSAFYIVGLPDEAVGAIRRWPRQPSKCHSLRASTMAC